MTRIYTLLRGLYRNIFCRVGVHKWMREPFTGSNHFDICCECCGLNHRFSWPPPPPAPAKLYNCTVRSPMNCNCFDPKEGKK